MPITVPQLDHQVFTPGPARDYAAHALQIAREFPDYAKQFREAQAAEMQRQMALQKYQNDALKAQAFLDMYPSVKEAEIAKNKAMAQMYGQHGLMYGARAQQMMGGVNEDVAKGISGPGFKAPPIGEEDAPAEDKPAPRRTDAGQGPEVDVDPRFRLGPPLPWEQQ